MTLPTTLAGLLVLLLAVLPGLPGEALYRAVAGVSWRERDLQRVLRLVSFSVIGVGLYALLAARLGLPEAAHVIPASYTSSSFGPAVLPTLAIAYAGHYVGAAAAGLLAAGAARALVRVERPSALRDAWDQFINRSVPRHWVVVRLKTGDAYAGMVQHADVAAGPEHRDIILAEPAEYVSAEHRYKVSQYQCLFLRGADIVSVAVVYDPELDSRVVGPGSTLFEEHDDGRRTVEGPAKTATSLPARPKGVSAGQANPSPASADAEAAPGTREED